jgi:hypothetical protein
MEKGNRAAAPIQRVKSPERASGVPMRLLWTLFSLSLSWSAGAPADLVVIAHPSACAERISRKDVVNIYMGRLRELPCGQAAQPLDLPRDGEETAGFYRLLVGKSISEINAYWARLLFSGRTQPPEVRATQDEMLDFVARTPQAIGYVDRSRVDDRVRILLELPR